MLQASMVKDTLYRLVDIRFYGLLRKISHTYKHSLQGSVFQLLAQLKFQNQLMKFQLIELSLNKCDIFFLFFFFKSDKPTFFSVKVHRKRLFGVSFVLRLSQEVLRTLRFESRTRVSNTRTVSGSDTITFISKQKFPNIRVEDRKG